MDEDRGQRSDDSTPSDLHSIFHHVFLPPKLPQEGAEDEIKLRVDVALCSQVRRAASRYMLLLPQGQQKDWKIVVDMMNHLLAFTTYRDTERIGSALLSMNRGDVRVFHMRAQNAALIARRKTNGIVFEAFEISPSNKSIMSAAGKLVCSYPGSAVIVPTRVVRNEHFVDNLASFLVVMDQDSLDSVPIVTKAKNRLPEFRDTAHPRYITELLMGILLGFGKEYKVRRISKHLADEICYKDALTPWRRSPLWLTLRVALQTSLPTREVYKSFMIFFHARLLQKFLSEGFDSDSLVFARKKTSRRVFKLNPSSEVPDFVIDAMTKANIDIKATLQKRWMLEQDGQASSSSWTPNHAEIADASFLSLPKCTHYLTRAQKPTPTSTTVSAFQPPLIPRFRDVEDFSKFCPEVLLNAVKSNTYVSLADFELAVLEHIDAWATTHLQDREPDACATVASCLEQYITSALERYASDGPVDRSIMLLTIMQLWVALDRITVAQVPLLDAYPPEIPADILDPLVLRHSRHIERAGQVQRYLRKRHRAAQQKSSVFSDAATEDCFRVRFYMQSKSLRRLKSEIIKVANGDRVRKLKELEQKSARYEALLKEASGLDYMWFETRTGSLIAHRHCRKRSLEKQARDIRIELHEWPLPRDNLDARVAAFELDVPRAFAIWRSQTYRIIRDIGMAGHSREQVQSNAELVKAYVGLQPWSAVRSFGRITMASSTKSHLRSHYHHGQSFPTTAAFVCVNNGLTFRLYDQVNGEWAAGPFSPDFTSYCTPQLPSRSPYSTLQYSVSGTTHTTNQVIAGQSTCPDDLTVHEYIAFGTLRSGASLQWLNIVRELRTGILSFSHEDVLSLITQAVWQVGPLDEDGESRHWHRELELHSFGLVLTRECETLLSRVQSNWLECITVLSIIYLLSRLLASTKDQDIRHKAHAILRNARDITYRWMTELVGKIAGDQTEGQIRELRNRICEMAATCRATYDVDHKEDLDGLLDTRRDMCIVLECAARLEANTPPTHSPASLHLQRLINRDRRLSHFLEPILYDRLLAPSTGGCGGLNDALRLIWPSYDHGVNPWRYFAGGDLKSWWRCRTSGHGLREQQVHFDLSRGLLLIDGQPLGRLPRSIVEHELYIRLFGYDKSLDVVPSEVPGMDFSTKDPVGGYVVSFALRDRGQSLKIQARSSSGDITQLVPHDELEGDFPTFLLTEHVHWLRLSNGEIDFRPLDRPWDASSTTWRLRLSSKGKRRLRHVDTQSFLLDPHSETFKAITGLFGKLEDPTFITILYQPQSQNLTVDLPRFRLSFKLDNDEFQSCNIPGMILDCNQSSGTMIGLRTQLLLRAKGPITSTLPRSRCVVIPHGSVKVKRTEDHVEATIVLPETQRHVTWHEYRIDADLGCLKHSGNLASRLFKIYLHALCSHPLPDPLTNRTGTEESLFELRSASTLSFQKLTKEDVELLQLIRAITPVRVFYPAHLKAMQTTEWSNNLPSSSQHPAFEPIVEAILKHGQTLQSLFSDPTDDPIQIDIERRGEPDGLLMDRSTHRWSLYDGDGIGCRDRGVCDDVHYVSRGHPSEKRNSRARTSTKFTQLVRSLPSVVRPRPLSTDELLNLLRKWSSRLRGPGEDIHIGFDEQWLQPRLPEWWLNLYDCLRLLPRPLSPSIKIQLSFMLSTLAYCSGEHADHIHYLVAFATLPEFSGLAPPSHSSYNLEDYGFEPETTRIKDIIHSHAYTFHDKPSAIGIEQESDEDEEEFDKRRKAAFDARSRSRTRAVVDFLLSQWPSPSPSSPFDETDASQLFDTGPILSDIAVLFRNCYHNLELGKHARKVQQALAPVFTAVASPATVSVLTPYSSSHLLPPPTPRAHSVRLSQLLDRSITIPPEISILFEEPDVSLGNKGKDLVTVDTSQLTRLVSHFSSQRDNGPPMYRLYGKQLRESLAKLDKQPPTTVSSHLPAVEAFVEFRDRCQRRMQEVFQCLVDSLSPQTLPERLLFDAGIWPRTQNRRTVLRLLLAATFDTGLQPESVWKEALTTFAQAFIQYQRSQRLVDYVLRGDTDAFHKELANDHNHMNRCFSDWLLVQIEGNFSARSLQSDVAEQMIAPSSKRNTVLQLNMGEGKSSVIVPLVSASLADSDKLVRVVVLKSLSGQMFDLLVERLSGLCDRRIYYLPFSRSTEISNSNVTKLGDLFKECARVKGVLVIQPEHILSLQLMTIDRLLSPAASDSVVDGLQGIEDWLEDHSRDILDESDEILHVKYQLVYTNGEQQALEGSSDRWITTQQVFKLVNKYAERLYTKYPELVELSRHAKGGFPTLRIIGKRPGKKLVSWIANDALSGCLDNLNFVSLGSEPRLRSAALQFISNSQVSEADYETVRKACSHSSSWNGLLLLRGLLAHGILVYCLGVRRWRVDYGVDHSRSLLAIPFRAKDVPTARSEFGHPEVAISLTCLSYYYGGLTEAQVRECFDILYKLDNPDQEFELWVNARHQVIPATLRQLNGVNTQDAHQFKEHVLPHFYKNQATVDFFLSQVVFPRHAKEFPNKLAMSAWDLAETKPNVTTGFSGTNDNSYLLPTSIEQQDPVDQSRTNAEVLMYLLKPQNRKYICTAHPETKTPRSCVEFLELIVKEEEEVRVLLDVGAQMLELKNEDLVRHWLTLEKDAAAGVFFDDSDHLTVLAQDGSVQSFASSPFRQQLEKCVVYLDDAHTRGTDLKLPSDYRAAVTLGPKVTKDRLVQGCMRMRKLASGQSVMFCAPLEVDRRIRAVCNLDTAKEVAVEHVLHWTMRESCDDILHNVPHWAEQGVDYETRRGDNPSNLKEAWLRPEARSLEELYGPSQDSQAQHPAYGIPAMKKRLKLLGIASIADARIEEEQEREVSQEVEQERQVERPAAAKAAKPRISQAVYDFVTSGIVPATASADYDPFVPLLSPLFSSIKVLRSPIWRESRRTLLATRDFATTIDSESVTNSGASKFGISEYMHPVNWIVSARQQDGTYVYVVMSAYEVNKLLPWIRDSEVVRLHMFAPRVTQAMEGLDDLAFYCVPPLPDDEESEAVEMSADEEEGEDEEEDEDTDGKDESMDVDVQTAEEDKDRGEEPEDDEDVEMVSVHSEERSEGGDMSMDEEEKHTESEESSRWPGIPLSIRCQLMLFAGQLYLPDSASYEHLCRILGLSYTNVPHTSATTSSSTLSAHVRMDDDRFIRPDDRNSAMLEMCLFKESPVPVLKEFVGLRRKGMGFGRTHVGKMLHGRLLDSHDFRDEV